MKKIRESFHMIAAAVFCIVMSMQAGLFPGSGRAVALKAGELGCDAGVSNVSGNRTVSLMRRIKSKMNNYIRKVFFWPGGPGDRKVMILSGIPPSISSRFLIL